MKLYAHYAGRVLPISVDPSYSVQKVQDLVGNVLGMQRIALGKYENGREIAPEIKIESFFAGFDDVYVLKAEEVKQPETHLKALEPLHFASLTKYSFYEYDSNWVRVEVPFPGIKSHDKSKITCKFDDNSFVLTILDFNGKNFQFSVMRLQCKIQADLCKHAILQDKIRISLRKVKDTDNWFSLFKAKTIGGDD